MILNKKVYIIVYPNTRKYYLSVGYHCINYSKIYINVNDLPKGSNIEIDVSCDVCGIKNSIKYNKYIKNTKRGKDIYCCKKCSYIKVKRTKFEKYGDENYNGYDKSKRTKFEKYGDENYNGRDKSKSTCIKKYGVDNVSKSDLIKSKRKDTNIKNWGVDNVFKSEEIKNKISKSIFEKYGVYKYINSDDFNIKYRKYCESLGVDHYSQSDEFKKKFEETCLRKWGYRTNLLNIDIINKIKDTNLYKYGFDSVMKNSEISLKNSKSLINGRKEYFENLGYEYIDYDFDKKIYNLVKKDCGHIFNISYDLFRSRIKYSNNSCLICYPKNDMTSIKECEVFDYVNGLVKNVVRNSRDIIGPKEIDIYLPDKKIGIEFNGLYYHSDMFKDKKYHIEKTNLCKSKGISLLHIWEDDWVNRRDIIKSIIKNKLGMIDNKIYARKCEIYQIDNRESNKFLDDNHIQSGTNASICICLKYENKIVSIMTFGNRRMNNKNSFELIRFCNKINYTVIGSASKLFNYFKNNFNYKSIISYSDKSIFDGNIYETLGFKNDGDTNLNYYWTDLYKRYHRFNFNKKKLVKLGYDEKMTEEQIMKNIGYYKIWSCGQIRWILNNKN